MICQGLRHTIFREPRTIKLFETLGTPHGKNENTQLKESQGKTRIPTQKWIAGSLCKLLLRLALQQGRVKVSLRAFKLLKAVFETLKVGVVRPSLALDSKTFGPSSPLRALEGNIRWYSKALLKAILGNFQLFWSISWLPLLSGLFDGFQRHDEGLAKALEGLKKAKKHKICKIGSIRKIKESQISLDFLYVLACFPLVSERP